MGKSYYIKLYFFIVFTFLLCCESDDSISANQIVSIHEISTLGGTKNESGQSVVATSDGGFAVLGYSQSMDGDLLNKSNISYDFWLIKYNFNGEQEWQKVYGGSSDDRGYDIILSNDNNMVILGSSKSADGDVSSNAGSNDFWIAKISNSGAIIWEKSLGYNGSDNGYSVIQTIDNGYLLLGVLDVTASDGEGNNRISSYRHAGGDYWAVKLDSNGILEWSRYFGGNFTDTSYAACQTQGGDYIIIGSSDSNDIDISNNKGTYDFWIIKISSEGNLIWEKSYGGSEIDEALDITPTTDGNFIVCGNTRSNNIDVSSNNGAADIWILKITPNGEILWEKTYGGNSFEAAKSVHQTTDNGFIIAGNSRSDNNDLTKNNGQNDGWIFKINQNGILQWQTSIGGSNIDLLMDSTQLQDGSIVAVGNTSSSDLDISENKGFTDLLLIRLNP
jgi:hypothetical protein